MDKMDNIIKYLNDIGFVLTFPILDELLYDKTSYLSYAESTRSPLTPSGVRPSRV